MADEQTYKRANEIFEEVIRSVEKSIVGQRDVIENILVSVVVGQHTLLEGYPGLGKTMMIRAISSALDMDFSRIQCTPDLMPSDITGTYVIEEEQKTGKKSFRFQPGPIFSNIVLADEINRATPKTQSALLEAMQEKQVTAGTATYNLQEPFFVLATQNPLEMEGTYPLPEAQLDRFLLKLMVKYPNAKEEAKIIDLYTSEKSPKTEKVLDKKTVLDLGKLARMIPISQDIKDYVMRIVISTRPSKENEIAKQYFEYGASSRAAIGIVLAAKAKSLLSGRNFVGKEDVIDVAKPVLRHRVILNFESEREGVGSDDVIDMLLKESR